MSELKRTQLYEAHVAAGATMVDFGGWEMPIKYPTDIVAEHLYTRHFCSLFDVSHMGRILVEGPEAVAFLQHVLSSNVMALDVNQAQYAILPTPSGGAVDDAYLYRFEADRYLLVVNAANTDKDLAHLREQLRAFDAKMTVITGDVAAIAVQGPKAKELLMALSGGEQVTEPVKNALNTLSFEGRTVRVAKTGYTGEPIGYEVYIESDQAVWLWNRLQELGAKPAGLGARDTLRLEAALPLYGHELGTDPEGKEIPVYAVPVAKFAVSFSEQKGDFIGRAALAQQYDAYKRIMDRDFSGLSVLPRRIRPIALLGRGVMRAGMPVYRGEEQIGWVTSGTMVPYYTTEGEGLETVILEKSAMRAIGLAYIAGDVLDEDRVEVDVRGRRIAAVIPPYHLRADAPPYARPIIYAPDEEENAVGSGDRVPKALELIQAQGKRPGVVIKPRTPAEAVLPFLDKCAMVLVMTVEPGFGGQAFMPDMMDKVRAIRGWIHSRGLDCELEVDGGIGPATAPVAVAAGANVLVAGSAVYKAADIPGRIRELRGQN